MKKLNVFYHFFIPDTYQGFYWFWWLDEQLGLMERSGLVKVANINVCITMPKYWSTLMWNKQIRHPDTGEVMPFYQKVVDYINLKFPFVNILDIRDTGEPNIYEGNTLKQLWDHCSATPDEYVLYLHSKGNVNVSVETKNWRDILNEIIINQWPMRYHEVVNIAETVGILDGNPRVFSGNFWWARTNYIASLPSPDYNEAEGRYTYENWVRLNNPTAHIPFTNNAEYYDHTHVYRTNIHQEIKVR